MDVSRACNRQEWRGDVPAPRTAKTLPRERLPRAEPWSGDHPIPFRTRQLSPTSPKVLRLRAAGGQVVPLAGGAFCAPAALTGRPNLPMLRGPAAFHIRPCFGLGAARRPLGPKAGESEMRQGLSLTSSGEQVRQNCIIIWTPCRVSFCFKGQIFCQIRTPGFCEIRFAGGLSVVWQRQLASYASCKCGGNVV